MKTRGKTKVDVPGLDYGKDGMDPNDLLDDGDNTNGFAEEKVDIAPSGRGDGRNGRGNATARRPGRMPRVGAASKRSDKQLLESAEFNEVVQGFYEFIEEINKRKKKGPKKDIVKGAKVAKSTDEPEKHKMVKLDTGATQAQLNEKFDQQNETDASKLYRFNEENTPQPGKFPTGLGQDQGQAWPKEAENVRAQKENPLNKQFPGMMDFNPYDPNTLKFLQNGNLGDLNALLMKQQQQQAQAARTQNPYGFAGDNNLFKDMMQKIQMQHFGDQNPMRAYMMPQFDPYGGKNSANDLMNLQMIEALLKGNPNLIHMLTNPSTANALFDLTRDMPYMMQGVAGLPGQQPYAGVNRSLGADLIQNEPEISNPRALEGKLGRAATHVAIAYFIYFKSLDSDTIAKCDKSKMDPTYNSRMLKEKKYEGFTPEQNALNKLLPPGFENFQLSNQDIQRLLEQGALTDPLQLAQLQRLQQEAMLRNEELARAAAMGAGKNEIKIEDDKEKRRAAAAKREQTEPKEEEIIEIKENSDVEEAPKPAQAPKKDDKTSQGDKKSSVGGSQPKGPETSKASTISAEDIVEEITELTNPGSFEIDKQGNRRKKNSNNSNTPTPTPGSAGLSNNGKKPVGKPEVGKPEPKTFQIEDDDDNVAIVQPPVKTDAGRIEEEAPKPKAAAEVILSSDEEKPAVPAPTNASAIQEEKPVEAPKPSSMAIEVDEGEKKEEKKSDMAEEADKGEAK